MLSTIYTILAFAVALGILVFVHEMGHFLAARAVGVRVDVFCLGFDPTLLQWRIGDTYWRLGALPLGGYTKLAGEHVTEATGDPQEYLSKPKLTRIAISAAGPALSLVTAVFLTMAVHVVGAPTPSYLIDSAIVGWVDEHSPAADAGVTKGDRIISVSDRPTPHWEDVDEIVTSNVGTPLETALMRGSSKIVVKVTPSRDAAAPTGSVGWYPLTSMQLGEVVPGTPAAVAGLQPRDEIVSVDGMSIQSWPRLLRYLGDKPLRLTIRRQTSESTVSVKPIRSGIAWTIGAETEQAYFVRRLSLIDAFLTSLRINKKYASAIVFVLKGLVTRQATPSGLLSGISATESPDRWRLGLVGLLSMMGTLSLNLCILNLLPIPVLDGGVIALLLIEIGTRRELDDRTRQRLMLAGFVILMLLMSVVIYDDLMRVEWPQWIRRLM